MMTYIILTAGKGSKLYPLTLKCPKTSYRLDRHTTVLQKMIRGIRRLDRDAEIVVVAGYLADTVRREVQEENVKVVVNPFYEVTNSITSVWFARDYLERENVAIVHGDAVFEDALVERYLVQPTDRPYVLVDSSYLRPGCYNVVADAGRVLVMSKKLEHFDAKFCCMTKLDAVSARLVKQEVSQMVYANMYDQYFEDALVQMIMFRDFQLFCVDIRGHAWHEVDNVDDLLGAQRTHLGSSMAGEELGQS